MKFYFLQQRQSNDSSLAKNIFVHSDIYNYSTRQNKAEQGRTRQNKAEQGRTVNQRFEKWIKGSSEKKVHQKKVHEKGPLGKINRITKFSVDSRYLRSIALNVI